ncbi:OLC1v1013848C1 [Oldenlandia corymbosa var. corymbosa]|uniref:OLC1v1013848C1 n=1 Tax=Oldenlandia corymbosa var. corymbosa TaxID=529605 RepID=A0AAV1DZ97_OLDCO|nr:OLC1v1013848C1 [Oldenlandia corymbosa var. corymbosa]
MENHQVEVKIPEIMLNSGHKMPVIGFGCAILPPLPQEEEVTIFIQAMENGYRHFDTASYYGSEEALGEAIAKALEIGLIKDRDELFITSKLWVTDTHYDLVLPAIKTTLSKLRLDYLDLYLVHWPVRVKRDANVNHLLEGEVLPFDMHGTWKAMEECCELGLTKSIGLSNFTCEKISKLLQNATIQPAINQVALRWIYEQGASLVVKSTNKERMKQNLKIFDWELAEEEKEKILHITQRRLGKADGFIVPNGPIKSVEEFWDGDL